MLQELFLWVVCTMLNFWRSPWFAPMSTIAADSPDDGVPEGNQDWEAFKTVRPALQPGRNWPLQKMPQEIQHLQEGDSLPEKLKHILAWSLSVNAPQTVNQAPEKTTESNSDSQPAGHDPTRQGGNTYGPQSTSSRRFEAGEGSLRRSRRSEHGSTGPSSLERRSVKARHIRHSLLGSSLDLIATLKAKAEKDLISTTGAHKAANNKICLVECTSCFDEFPKIDTAKLACAHSYCKPCLATLVTTAIQNESSFPPKCCLTQVPLQTALLPLNAKQREMYQEKAAEYSIPAQKRWYCPNKKCLKWIAPATVRPSRSLNRRCPHCATKICSICRATAHSDSTDCPQDAGLEATISLAELEGWRRCFKCRTMVEVRTCS